MSTIRQLRRRAPRIYKHAREHGWEVVGLNGRGHFRLRHNDTGRHATMAATPGDWRAELNTLAWMRRIEAGTDHGRGGVTWVPRPSP